MISGINGGKCILSSMAKIRVESSMINEAEVIGSKGSYHIVFHGFMAEWKCSSIVLSSSRQPYKPRIFKSIDGAISELIRIGLTEASVKITNSDR